MPNAMKVVIDLDGTAVIGFDRISMGRLPLDTPSVLRSVKTEYPFVSSFQENGLLVFARHWHVIFPGFIEALRWLDEQKVRIAFFSAGEESRNQLLVLEILKLAFGKDAQEKWSQIQLFSRGDLQNYKKNLKLALSGDETLSDTIGIDDNPACVFPEQERHMFVFPTITDLHFSTVHAGTQCDESLFRVNQWAYLIALMDEAMKLCATETICLSEAFSRAHRPVDMGLLEQGAALLQAVNPSFCLAKRGAFFASELRDNSAGNYEPNSDSVRQAITRHGLFPPQLLSLAHPPVNRMDLL